MLLPVALPLFAAFLSGVVASLDGPYDVVLDRNTKDCQKVDLQVLEFQLYTRENPKECQKLFIRDDGESLHNSFYNTKKNTKILIHGWAQSEQPFKRMLLADYLLTQDVNVIVVNWSEYAKFCTLNSTRDRIISGVSRFVNKLVKQLHVYGSEPRDNIHMIAYGVGAHIAGLTAKILHPTRIARITALDPTGYGFNEPWQWKLQNGDARFIDIIYTSLPIVSADKQVADASFYPNGGTHPQPNVADTFEGALISSWDSVHIFKASITMPKTAYKCDNYLHYVNGECDTIQTTFGEHLSKETIPGNYYFKATFTRPVQTIDTLIQ